jgi:hypothetical protein
MGMPQNGAYIEFDNAVFRDKFDREPLGFTHHLDELDLFASDSLRDLAQRYTGHAIDYFVSASAPVAQSEFGAVPHDLCSPCEAMSRLQSESIRLLLKRPENYHRGFRFLLDEVFAEVTALRGGMRGERLLRLESAVFVSSADSITPVHFDPEIAFFFQIEGDKSYHIYPPRVMAEADLERFYLRGEISIGHVELDVCDPALEQIYRLRPGAGLHQPQNSPHWVQTHKSRTVSYSCVFETNVSRRRGQARACNYYLRKIGVEPAIPGCRADADALKGAAMRVLLPIRRRLVPTLDFLRGAQPIPVKPRLQ